MTGMQHLLIMNPACAPPPPKQLTLTQILEENANNVFFGTQSNAGGDGADML